VCRLICLCIFLYAHACAMQEEKTLMLYSEDNQLVEVDGRLWSGAFPLSMQDETGHPYSLQPYQVIPMVGSDISFIQNLLKNIDAHDYQKAYALVQNQSRKKLELMLNQVHCLGMADDHSLKHICAQGIVRHHRRQRSFGPEDVGEIGELYNFFDCKMPFIAPSLKMYLYLSLSIAERRMINEFVAPFISVSDFVQQIPEPGAIVCDRIGAVINNAQYLKHIPYHQFADTKRAQRIAGEFFEATYVPFWQEIVRVNPQVFSAYRSGSLF
jgi:hypothetical protein